MFEIFISKIIDKDIRLDIEAFLRQKLLSFDKGIVIKVSEGSMKGVLYQFDAKGNAVSQDLLNIIELAKDLLKVKIAGRKCYEKFKAECLNCGVSIE